MTRNLMQRIEQRYSKFTPSYKRIADYLKAHYEESQYLSISNLADRCGVAEATVSRFCRTLGFQGYNELKLALAKSSVVEDQQQTYEVYGDITAQDSVKEMAKRLYHVNIAALEETLALVDEDAIRRSGQMLMRAKKVFCFGQGGSLVTAMEAWSRFLNISSKFFCVEDTHMQIMAASLLEPGDVILFVSYSGSTRDAHDILAPAKAHGARVILITHFQESPAAKLADEVLLCGGEEGPLQAGSIAVKMAMLLVVDILVNEYCRHNIETTMANRDITSDALACRHF